MPKFAIGEQVENVADDPDQSAAVAAFPAVGGSTPRALDTENSFWNRRCSYIARSGRQHVTKRPPKFRSTVVALMSHQGHRRPGAIDVTRPLPFTALPRPALAGLAKDLLRKKDDEE